MITRKKILKISLQYFCLTISFLFTLQWSYAQSNYKEASNNFALYTQTAEMKHLEAAKKFVDQGYKTRRDSSNTRMNVLRAMVYSSIAYADSTRKIKNNKDAIDLTLESLSKLRVRDIKIYENEIAYVKQNLSASYTYKANNSLSNKKYDEAYQLFLKIAELQPDNEDIIYNIALLADQANQLDHAVVYYQKAISSKSRQPNQFLELANVYDKKGDKAASIKTLEAGRELFPSDRNLLLKLVQSYAQVKNFDAIVNIIEEALKFEPENIELNYLAGFSFENTKKLDKAKLYYEKAVVLDRNNYEANLALGLIFLDNYLNNGEDHEAQYHTYSYLLRANEIRPHEINALKALALYYEKADDEVQLDRVNMLLNRLLNY